MQSVARTRPGGKERSPGDEVVKRTLVICCSNVPWEPMQPPYICSTQNKYKETCLTIIGCQYWNDIHIFIYVISRPENYVKSHFTGFILLSINKSNINNLFTMGLLFPLVH